MNPKALPKSALAALLSMLFPLKSWADTPLGWISSANSTAYTTTKGELEVSAAAIAVNDSIDFLNYRDDLVASTGRLEGDSGDLSGSKLEIHYGITRDIDVFYRRQDHSLTLELGELSSINLIDIDDSLETTAQSAGLKWTLYRSNLLNPGNRQSALSVEVSAFANMSDNFDVVLDEIRLTNLSIFFSEPQTFSVSGLEDRGWKARLLYTWPMENLAIGTIWTGYGTADSKSGTTSTVESATLRRLTDQQFETEESYLYLGASINTQLTPRLSLNANYEYIRITDNEFRRFPEQPSSALPSFLSQVSQAAIDDNHTLTARLGYWLTPELNLSLTGSLYSNQFIGIMPHYNNSLSGSFSSTPYGFAGLELNYKIRGLP